MFLSYEQHKYSHYCGKWVKNKTTDFKSTLYLSNFFKIIFITERELLCLNHNLTGKNQVKLIVKIGDSNFSGYIDFFEALKKNKFKSRIVFTIL